ncbi:MAG: hypothetical protein M1813_000665 [Trichoglossum hirsutum]|nr:MAG: hypothetical protein M1813_000665 [Trichoglossum hirsutum]
MTRVGWGAESDDEDAKSDGDGDGESDGNTELEGVRESREDDETGKGEESGEAGELEEKMDDAEEEETSSNPLTDRKQHSRSCSCPKEIIALIPHSGAKLGDEAGLTIVKRVREAGRKPHSSAMCQPHLQLLAAGAIRLYNKAGDKL